MDLSNRDFKSLDPLDITVQAHVFQRQRQYQKALAFCDQVLLDHPHSPEAYFEKGSTLESLSRFKEAESHYRLALQHGYIMPGYAHYRLGTMLNHLKRFEEAHAVLQKAIDLGYDDKDVYWQQEIAYHDGQKQKEEEKQQKTTQLDLKTATEEQLAFAVFKLSNVFKYKEANALCDDILKHHPKNAKIHNEKAEALMQLEHYEDAIKHFKLAIEYKYWYLNQVYYDMGVCFNHLKRFEEAHAVLQKAIDLGYDDKDVYYQEVKAYLALKKHKDQKQQKMSH